MVLPEAIPPAMLESMSLLPISLTIISVPFYYSVLKRWLSATLLQVCYKAIAMSKKCPQYLLPSLYLKECNKKKIQKSKQPKPTQPKENKKEPKQSNENKTNIRI